MTQKLSRRTALSALGSGALVLAFDPCSRTWLTQAHADNSVPVPVLDGELVTDETSRNELSDDFGYIRTGVPVAVLRPGSYQDIAAMVQFARAQGLCIAMRGNGHSNYGQALAEGGIAIDSSTLDAVHAVGPHCIDVDAGVFWRTVITAATAIGSAPPTLTDYLNLTVGGTLSMGGIGGATHQHGLQLDNVLELTVVTGTGAICTCSPTHNSPLFYAVLGGGGQCGIIVRAKLRLQTVASEALQANLYYDDLATYVADMELVMHEERFDYLEGQVIPQDDGSQLFMMEIAVYHAPDDAPDTSTLFAGLSDLRSSIQVTATTYLEWAARVDAQEAFLRSIGFWDVPHPWLNLFIPSSKVEEFMATALAELTPANTGGGVVLFYPIRRSRICAPLFRLPLGETSWSLSVLRFVPDPSTLQGMLDANRSLYDLNKSLGGTRYTIGAIPFEQADWQAHYGVLWPAFAFAKAVFDPDKVLTPGPGIF